jgi:SAM-dependent methyltransferase
MTFPSRYQHVSGNLLAPRNAPPFTYSDGQVEDHIAEVVANARDCSVMSVELLRAARDWPTKYYLSYTRSFLLRPLRHLLQGKTVLELGAGCGALTRYLGETAGRVVGLEGSPRRAGIAASRCRDLANVTIDLVQLDADGYPGPSLLLFASPPRSDQRGQFDFAFTVTIPSQGNWLARLFSVNDIGSSLSVSSNTCHVGPPSNGYTGGNFLPALDNGYIWTYSRQIGRWDSRAGWLRLHIHLAVLTRTNPGGADTGIVPIDLTTAGIPQSAWPSAGIDHGYWGFQRTLRATNQPTDMFQPLLFREGDSLKVIMQHFNSDADESGMVANRIGNHPGGATILDLSWVIPDPSQSTLPSFDPKPDLQQANLTIKGTGTAASIQVYIRARTLTVKAPDGQTLAGCRLLVQSLSMASNTSAPTRINRTFTDADGAVANVELSWYHLPWNANASYKTAIQAQLFSPTGQFVSFTGNTYSFKNTGKTPSS